MQPPPANPPHEPEIEALGRAAHGFLWLVRRLFWLGGLGGVGYGVWRCYAGDGMSWAIDPAALGTVPSAKGVVWLCLAFPALLPVDWTFGRGRWLVLAVSAALWFGAMELPEDHRYGFVLRIVATFVAAASLLVWRTLWRLTSAAAAARRSAAR
jgi:hypothetical protein